MIERDDRWSGVEGGMTTDDLGHRVVVLEVARHGQRLGYTVRVDPAEYRYAWPGVLGKMVREIDAALHA